MGAACDEALGVSGDILSFAGRAGPALPPRQPAAGWITGCLLCIVNILVSCQAGVKQQAQQWHRLTLHVPAAPSLLHMNSGCPG